MNDKKNKELRKKNNLNLSNKNTIFKCVCRLLTFATVSDLESVQKSPEKKHEIEAIQTIWMPFDF